MICECMLPAGQLRYNKCEPIIAELDLIDTDAKLSADTF
jgi:hypothetical protein